MKRAGPALVMSLAALAATGCYQALGAGYAHRFAERGGHAFEGSYLFGLGEAFGDDTPLAFAKATVMGGEWGVRGADVIGVMAQEDLDGATFFLRPGVAFLVIGAEFREPAASDRIWAGIGAEVDVGFLIEAGDSVGIEIGARAGGDLSYTGVGSGGFVGAFLSFAWVWEGPDWVTR